jgi:hypothetical protein
MQKNSAILTWLLMLGVLLSVVFLPFHASAYTIPTIKPISVLPFADAQGRETIIVCPSDDTGNLQRGFTSRLIPCIRDTIIYATVQILQPFVEVITIITRSIITLAIVLYGITVIAGTGSKHVGFATALKIGGVMMYLANVNAAYPRLLNALEELLGFLAKPAIAAFAGGDEWNRVSSTNSSPNFTCAYTAAQASEREIMGIWNILDCFIDRILGGIITADISSLNPESLQLSGGILGFIVAAMFSTVIGVFVALAGLYLLSIAMFTVLRVMYIFLTSYIAFSFMVLISPIFVPCILFNSSKRFFDGWMRTTTSFLLQPIFSFGYLIMFLVAINTTVFAGKYSLYHAIAGTNSQDTDFMLGTWVNASGGYAEQLTATDNLRIASDGTPLDPLANDTSISDRQGQRLPDGTVVGGVTVQPITSLMGTRAGTPLSFFQTGIPVRVLDWKRLAETAMPAEFAAATTQADRDRVYLDYKIRVLISFVMTAIILYVFYSLLEYLPYIGSGTLGSGPGGTLGIGRLSAPGSSTFGGGVG